MNKPHPLQSETRPWPNASDERLDVIESNECGYQENSLATKRFRAVFNALAEALKDREHLSRPAAEGAGESQVVAWLVRHHGRDGSEEREVVLSPLTDGTYMDEGDEAYPLIIQPTKPLSRAPVARDGVERQK